MPRLFWIAGTLALLGLLLLVTALPVAGATVCGWPGLLLGVGLALCVVARFLFEAEKRWPK